VKTSFPDPQGRLKIEDQVGSFDQASYFVKRQSAPAVAAQGGKQPDLPWAEGQDESTTGFAAPRVLGIKPGQTRLKSSTKPANELTEARGEAERIDLDGENQYRLTSATYTTCKPGNDDWYLSFAEVEARLRS
jgi:LPS-assembly protein